MFRWVNIVVGLIGLAAFAVWLVIQFSHGDLDRGDKLASIVSMSVTVVTLPLSVLAIVITLRQGRQEAPVVSNLDQLLDAAAENLAGSVRAQWQTEERIRHIHDPFPLPVRWTNAAENLADHWQNINGSHDRCERIVLNGQGAQIVDTFNRIPSGRLVVLGRAGAGKTILTSRFALTLLAQRPTPVPVVLPLGSWDPTTTDLRDWLAAQLIATYPVLADRITGTTLAERLLATGRIFPVLDGFDEISGGLRAEAIRAINIGLRPHDKLLLTSRPEEYAAAVAAADVVNSAAVVKLDDLGTSDLAAYLPLTTRRVTISHGRNKWESVLDHLLGTPESPLGDVLATPLMVALARACYSDTDDDPAELLTFTSASDVEDRLLAGFVPAVYSSARRDRSPFSADEAYRHLTFVARHLYRQSTHDLAWWRLAWAVPRFVIALITSLLITAMIGAVIAIVGWWGNWPAGNAQTAWIMAGFPFSLIGGLYGGTVAGSRRSIRPVPARLRLSIRGSFRRATVDLMFGLGVAASVAGLIVWTVGGAVIGIAGTIVTGDRTGVPVGAAGGLFVGIGIGFVVVLTWTLAIPANPSTAVSPGQLLRTDRAAALHQGLVVGAGGSIVQWLTIWMLFMRAFHLRFGLVFGDGVWLAGWLLFIPVGMTIWIFCVTVWGQWLIARFWLPLTGRLPWSIMTFLMDAHRRGVLRQVGGVYQFRHVRLRDYLAADGDHGRP